MPKIKVNDINIYYEIAGNGHPFVFIHGGGLESSSWHSQVAFFQKDTDVLPTMFEDMASQIFRKGVILQTIA